MRKSFWFTQFYVVLSLGFLLLNGCGNVAAQQEKEDKYPVLHDCLETSLPGCGPRIAIDIPPKEWDETHKIEHTADDLIPRDYYTEHHVVCEDKTRFKMQSEDHKWHCLKLTP